MVGTNLPQVHSSWATTMFVRATFLGRQWSENGILEGLLWIEISYYLSFHPFDSFSCLRASKTTWFYFIAATCILPIDQSREYSVNWLKCGAPLGTLRPIDSFKGNKSTQRYKHGATKLNSGYETGFEIPWLFKAFSFHLKYSFVVKKLHSWTAWPIVESLLQREWEPIDNASLTGIIRRNRWNIMFKQTFTLPDIEKSNRRDASE